MTFMKDALLARRRRSFTDNSITHICDTRSNGSRQGICGYDGLYGFKALTFDVPTCVWCVAKVAEWDVATRLEMAAVWALEGDGSVPSW